MHGKRIPPSAKSVSKNFFHIKRISIKNRLNQNEKKASPIIQGKAFAFYQRFFISSIVSAAQSFAAFASNVG